MRHLRGGYTVIEVLIVLAVSMVIFFAAVTLFAGRQGTTEFSQALRDVESRIKSAVNDVGVSTFPYAENYTCDIEPLESRPMLTVEAGGTGTNTRCIFLGKAIQLEPNSGSAPDRLRVYTVLGNRVEYGSTTAITDFNEVNTEPIMGIAGNPNLTEDYNILFGMKILSARQVSDPVDNGATYLMGFYNSLQPVNSAEGSQSLKTIGYVGPINYAPGQLYTSIKNEGPATQRDSKTWTICFQSGTEAEKAQLIVNASSAGVTTQIKYTDCS